MIDKVGLSSTRDRVRIRSVLLSQLVRIFSLSWLTGPIFDKELRVSSRRRRNFLLRFVYVSFFTFLLAMIWLEEVPKGTSSVYQSSRMAQAGQFIIVFVVWFQFIVCQAIAVVMLSTSISDEIYNRTLGLLMTTPVGGFQIVLGKLLSKLLQLILLLAITLPFLAIVRVFGGVPWNYLVCGLCVTLTSAIFVGSLSLFFSIFTRRAYSVIIVTVLTLAVLFALMPLALVLSLEGGGARGRFLNALSYANPFVMMSVATGGLASARSIGFQRWPAHCGIALGASAVLVFLATVFVRKAALRQAVGQTGLWPRKGKAKARDDVSRAASARRVVGSPVLWKERRSPLFGKRKGVMLVAILLAIGFLVFTYILCAREDMLDDADAHVPYVVIFTGLGMLFTTVLPASAITAEKESRTWPLLLTTTVGDWEIVWGKLVGVMRRCLPAWLPLFAHVTVFALGGIIHPVAIVQLAILVVWIVVFLSSSGLYFSTRFKHTTTAVIANVALAAGLWAIFPLLLGITLAVSHAGDDLLEAYMDMNPFVHAVVIAAATVHKGGLGIYDWIQGGMRDLSSATGWIVFNFVIYVVIGLAFVARAGARLRRNPF